MKVKIKIIKDDITRINSEAIVNAANKSLLGGGGVDGAIHRVAGPNLLKETKILGGCEVGQAKITKGYNLPAKYIIHTVGPIWRGGENNEKRLLFDCYYNSLLLARDYNIESIAFPAISTGAYGFPKKEAAKIAIKSIKEFLEKNAYSNLKEIIFVLFSESDLRIYKNIFKQIFKNG